MTDTTHGYRGKKMTKDDRLFPINPNIVGGSALQGCLNKQNVGQKLRVFSGRRWINTNLADMFEHLKPEPFWLVVGQTPLKNMTSSIGMMTFPIY